MTVSFSKYSATGNDFILMDNRDNKYDTGDIKFFNNIAQRRTGIGADGILLVENSEKSDFKMRYINSDGGEVEMCANGARAISFYSHHVLGLKKSDNHYTFETMNSVYEADVRENSVRLKMTELYDQGRIEISDLYNNISSSYLNTGVPHCVFELDEVDTLDIVGVARPIRNNTRFENGTNINFYKYLSGNKIQVRTYERGVEDETLSCGTGVVASAYHAAKKHKFGKIVNVQTKGGVLIVEFSDEGVFLEGDVDEVYCGTFEPGFFSGMFK